MVNTRSNDARLDNVEKAVEELRILGQSHDAKFTAIQQSILDLKKLCTPDTANSNSDGGTKSTEATSNISKGTAGSTHIKPEEPQHSAQPPGSSPLHQLHATDPQVMPSPISALQPPPVFLSTVGTTSSLPELRPLHTPPACSPNTPSATPAKVPVLAATKPPDDTRADTAKFLWPHDSVDHLCSPRPEPNPPDRQLESLARYSRMPDPAATLPPRPPYAQPTNPGIPLSPFTLSGCRPLHSDTACTESRTSRRVTASLVDKAVLTRAGIDSNRAHRQRLMAPRRARKAKKRRPKESTSARTLQTYPI